MNWLHVVWAFFLANLLGYGGGPSTIPLIQSEVVTNYHWLSNQRFGDVLAVANALPGPIATKLAAGLGFHALGIAGAFLALFVTILPSAVGLILLLGVLKKYRQAPFLRGMVLLIQPVIAIMMFALSWALFRDSVRQLQWMQSIVIFAVSVWLMKFRKIHPVFVILAAFAYGSGVSEFLPDVIS
ncbi:chromate transporter [Alicyclobacillus tolerans]|uniref:chromate transporter n=1 Tax=Alicyclobacillus tolerans TaxID=90970 RepID=UPI001F45EA21|nr:chromate transporter [Alicyclobacillus tolerans]MCF8563220.1 chromate transporter [Alicyclobacillus tolerans]